MASEKVVKNASFSPTKTGGSGTVSITYNLGSTGEGDNLSGGIQIVSKDTGVVLGAVFEGSASPSVIKELILKSLQRTIRDKQSFISTINKQLQELEAELATYPADVTGPDKIRRDGVLERIEKAKKQKADQTSDLAAAQSALNDTTATIDSVLEGILQKTKPPPEPPPKPAETPTNATSQTDAATPAKTPDPATGTNPPSASQPQTSGGGQAPPTTDNPGENKVSDETKNDAKTGENQDSGVVANPGTTTTIADSAKIPPGTQAASGNTGKSGKNLKPGRRLKNPLSYFSSSTYNITLYMITPDAYDAFIQSGRQKINVLASAKNLDGSASDISKTGAGAYIIAQSGGINNTTTNRAPGFELDYYIDNLRIKTATNASASQSATNTTALSFSITEPYGFSFITNLKRAQDGLKQYSQALGYKNVVNATKQFFILGIRFYGYDHAGRLLSGKDIKDGEPIDPNTDENGVFETFYDIVFTGVKFKLDGKAVRYDITAASIPSMEAWGLKRGRVKSDTTVEGQDVNECLTGTNGLLTQMNKQQEDMVGKEIEFPNIYKVKWADQEAFAEIGKAKMVLASDLDKTKFPMSGAQTSSDSTDADNPPPNPTRRKLAFAQDVSVIQAMTQLISRSRYLEKAMKTIHKVAAQPNPEKKEREVDKNQDDAVVSWFNISAELSNAKFDRKLNDWAYTITYVISIYETPVVTNAYSYPGGLYYGPHKRYEYWFTGKNSEVLEYTQNFDNTYFTVALAPDTGLPVLKADEKQPPAIAPENQGTQSGMVPLSPAMRTGGDTTGVGGTLGAEAQNAYVTSLYDPGAYASAKVKILGDPDFLVQESATSQNELYNRYYGTNGYTISANGGQVFVEIDFKEATDYKVSTGLLNINESILFYAYPPEIQKYVKGVSYQVKDVTSVFNNGSFIQELELIINSFNAPPGSTGSGFSDNLRDVPPATAPGTTTTNPPANSPGSSTGQAPGSPSSTTTGTGFTPAPAAPADPQSTLPNAGTVGSPTGQQTSSAPTDGAPVQDDDAAPTAPSRVRESKNIVPPPTAAEQELFELNQMSDEELFGLGYTPDDITKIRNGVNPGRG